ncbi:MAG: protein kinase [Nannocystaceae bacterium]|nr:protein kinase [Nannocystaceae bacterium]
MSGSDPRPPTKVEHTRSAPADSFSDVDSEIGEWVRDLAPVVASPRVLVPGQRIGAHFELVRQLGAGGMGVVWLARDDRLDRDVAIKLVGKRSERATARLAREAQAMARLSHPNVLVVHEVGEHEGSIYIAMEYVDGGTLRQWQDAGGHRVRDIVELYLQAARGLAAAHAGGFVHRDFKPDNVLLGSDGRVRVADFGLARTHGDSQSNSDISGDAVGTASSRRPELAVLTRTDAVLGTPAYMAPEQHGRAQVAPTVDQFAFGVALYEALLGTRPYGDVPNWLATDADYVAGRSDARVPRWLRATVRRMVAIEPRARLPDMAAVAQALERGLSRTRRWAWAGGSAAAIGLAAAVGLGIGSRNRDDACGDGDAIARARWHDGLRDVLDERFTADGGTAVQAWTHARDELDAWFLRWAEDRRSACEATRVWGSQSEALLDRSMACFDVRLAATTATLEFLRDDHEARRKLAAMMDDIPTLQVCSEATYLEARLPPPEDPEVRAQVEAIERRLRELGLALEVDGSGLAEQTEALLQEARALGWAPVLARAHALAGRLDFERGDHDRAQRRFREGYFIARRAGDDEAAATLAALLAYVAGAARSDRATAEIWLDHAEADLARGTVAPEQRAALASTRAQVLQRAGAGDEAVQVIRDAIASLEDATPRRSLQLRSELAAALDNAGRHREALTEYDALVPDLEAELGEWNPLTVQAYNNRGLCHYLLQEFDPAIEDLHHAIDHLGETQGYEAAGPQLNLGLALAAAGRPDDALAPLQRARAIYAATAGADGDVALVLNALGWVERKRGRVAEALALQLEALAKNRIALPEGHPEIAVSLTHVGDSELELGRTADAIAHLEEAVAVRERDPDRDRGATSTTVTALARAYAQAGRHDDALVRAEQVIVSAESGEVDDGDLAYARFVRAQVLAAQGKAAAAALEARLALVGFRHAGDDADAAQVQAWLDAHGGAAPP